MSPPSYPERITKEIICCLMYIYEIECNCFICYRALSIFHCYTVNNLYKNEPKPGIRFLEDQNNPALLAYRQTYMCFGIILFFFSSHLTFIKVGCIFISGPYVIVIQKRIESYTENGYST